MRSSILFLFLFLFSCANDYTPKPRAYFKINLPEKEYIMFNDNQYNFSFQHPIYSKIEIDKNSNFLNVNFSKFCGKLHLTYVKLDNNLGQHIEQARSLAYKHVNQADKIDDSYVINEVDNVYGMLYNYEGITATSTQFYLTDSINHFFRGSFYFNTEINDSIVPVNNFIKEDVDVLIKSFRWK